MIKYLPLRGMGRNIAASNYETELRFPDLVLIFTPKKKKKFQFSAITGMTAKLCATTRGPEL